MIALLAGTFLGSALVTLALYFAFATHPAPTAERLSDLWTLASPRSSRKAHLSQKLQAAAGSIGALIPASPQEARRTEKLLLRAGFRRPEALKALRGLKLIFPVVLVAVTLESKVYRFDPLFVLVAAAVVGFLLPEMWLTQRVRMRQRWLQRGLPDALDLLVICVEAGLGLDQAMLRVSRELALAYPNLSEELQLVNFEVRVGKTRAEALRGFATRTGVDDLQALVSILVQADRFGTSVAQALRVYSENLRTKRRQRAEELAAKTSVKMIPVLVLFIFPALLTVVLGPAVIMLIHQFAPMLSR